VSWPLHRQRASAAGLEGGWQLNRRELFTLLGAGIALVACGGKKKPAATPITTAASRATSPAAASTGASASAGISSGTSSSVSTASGSVVHLGGPHATGDAAMTVDDARREAAIANGHWQGGWRDATGASGDSDVMIAIDGASRTAKASVSFGGKPFGASIAPVTYDIDLLSFMMTADTYNVVSPQFGQVTIVPGGATNASGSARAIPGQPTIDHVEVNATKAGQRVDIAYTAHYADGHAVKGTMAWSLGGDRATPAALGTAGAPTTAEIGSGSYAAGLLDANALATIFGEPFQDPVPNGGKLHYDDGIDVSNGRASATSGDFVVQYSVYVGQSAAQTDAFWQKQLRNQPATSGPWKAGFFYKEIVTFYADFPTRVVTVQIVALKQNGPPSAADQGTQQQRTVAIATALATSLSKT
jgi:hypothetical protein